MKKMICSVAAIGLVFFCAGTHGVIEDSQTNEFYDDNDTKTLVERYDDEDENSVNDRIKQQKRLLSEKKSGKNYDELKILQKNGFVVTKKSLNDLQNNFNNAITVVDMFESVNTNSAIFEAFSFAMDENAESNFISGEYNLPKDIKKNSELFESMRNFMQNLDNPPKGKSENDTQIENLESLKNIYSILEKDKKIGEENAFSKFVKGMINVYKVSVARRLADEIMNLDRGSVEDKFTSTRSYSSAEVGAVARNGVVSAGASATYHTDKGTSTTSLYEINVGGGARLSVGIGNPMAIGAEVGASEDITKSAIFYSLEQLLDSGKVSVGVLGGILTAKDLKETLQHRQKMQARERKLLSIFGRDVEGYLKMIGKIPVSTYLEWPKLTKASPANEAVNVSKAIDASVVALKKIAGFNVVASDNIKTWKRPSEYMSLISDDCSPADGLTAEAIVKFLGKQYDISEIFGGKSDVNVLPTILGDIRAYNSVLSVLADDESNSKAEQRKHDIEKRWLPEKTGKFNFKSEGRLGALKSMIATVAVLRESAVTDKEIELFKQLYTEIYHLDQLMEFSKNKSNRSASFMAQATAHNKSIQVSASVEIPYFGNAQISFTNLIARDNPFREENGDFINFDAFVPVTPIGIVGTDAVDSSLNAYRQITEGAHSSFGYGDTFNLVKKGFNLTKNLVKVPAGVLKGTAAGFSGRARISASLVRIDVPKIYGEMRSLPHKKLIKRTHNQWANLYNRAMLYLSSEMTVGQYSDYVQKGADYLKTGVDVNKWLDTIRVKYSSEIGKEVILIGADTLRYLTSKFNAFSLGQRDSKDALSPWYSLKDDQKKQLMELFENVTDEKSNVIFELQNMYNVIMDNIGEKDTKTSGKCTRLFENFLDACSDLTTSKDDKAKEQAFEKASELLDEIFRMNFDYNFINDYEKAYQI